jgi:hypothetical protein
MSEEATGQVPDPLPRTERELAEVKWTLEDVKTKALSGVALALTEAAEK